MNMYINLVSEIVEFNQFGSETIDFVLFYANLVPKIIDFYYLVLKCIVLS